MRCSHICYKVDRGMSVSRVSYAIVLDHEFVLISVFLYLINNYKGLFIVVLLTMTLSFFTS